VRRNFFFVARQSATKEVIADYYLYLMPVHFSTDEVAIFSLRHDGHQFFYSFSEAEKAMSSKVPSVWPLLRVFTIASARGRVTCDT
jgi:hypothetical protein